jgi:hypothetical protein
MNGPALVNAPKTDLVDELANFAAGIDCACLDPAVVQAVKTNVLDTLACGLAGLSAPAIAEVTGLVREWGGAPQADMLVFGGKFPAHHAAWANAGSVTLMTMTTHTTPPFCMRALPPFRLRSPPVSCAAACPAPTSSPPSPPVSRPPAG